MFELIRRLADRWTHPGEFELQRGYRRYLEGLDHATPYPEQAPPTVTSSAWPTDEERAARRRQARLAQARRMARPIDSPIVGVRIDYGGPSEEEISEARRTFMSEGGLWSDHLRRARS